MVPFVFALCGAVCAGAWIAFIISAFVAHSPLLARLGLGIVILGWVFFFLAVVPSAGKAGMWGPTIYFILAVASISLSVAAISMVSTQQPTKKIDSRFSDRRE